MVSAEVHVRTMEYFGKDARSNRHMKSQLDKRITILQWIGLSFGLLALAGCGQTVGTVHPPTPQSEVDSYFGGPFVVAGSAFGQNTASFDHSANQIAVSGFIVNGAVLVPTE